MATALPTYSSDLLSLSPSPSYPPLLLGTVPPVTISDSAEFRAAEDLPPPDQLFQIDIVDWSSVFPIGLPLPSRVASHRVQFRLTGYDAPSDGVLSFMGWYDVVEGGRPRYWPSRESAETWIRSKGWTGSIGDGIPF